MTKLTESTSESSGFASAADIDVPLQQSSPMRVDRLKLDSRNPRLLSANEHLSQSELVRKLFIEEDLGELLHSIAANGYLNIEPLVVMFDKRDKMYIVLEGNRRLSAIKLLRTPEQFQFLKKGAPSDDESVKHYSSKLPEITDRVRATLEKVSIYCVKNREAARPFIGFKHVNGPAKWGSFAKAKFATEWYKSKKVSLIEISSKIGDRHDTVLKMVAAVYVLEQAEEANVFWIANRYTARFNFSHLYTALSRSQYREFLGLKGKWPKANPSSNPIPENKIGQLKEVLVWIYGSAPDEIKPLVQSQNPDIRNLGESLESKRAVAMLRDGKPLSEAFASSKSVGDTFAQAMNQAQLSMRDASHSIRGFDAESFYLIGVAEEISSSISMVLKTMQEKVKNVDKG